MIAWKKVKIGDFLTESKEEALNSDASKRITVRLNCKGVEKRPLKAEKEGATKYFIRHAGQFIYGKQNFHKGAFGIIPEELDGFTSSADLPAFDIDTSRCLPDFLSLCFLLNERYKALQKNVRGVGSQRLACSVFLQETVFLPDLNTQKEIVKTVSMQINKLEQFFSEIESQKSYAKQLRQNILQEAIEGKLTAGWRKSHPVQKGNPDFDAEALFEKIQEEKSHGGFANANRLTAISEKTVRSLDRTALAKNPCDKKKKAINAAKPITDAEKPFAIPDGWKWVRLGEICKSTPRNGYSPKAVDFETPIKTLKLGAVTYGVFNPNEFKYINEEIPKDAYCWLKKGDILIERSNSIEYVGICAIYTGKDNEFMYPDLLMKFRIFDFISTEFVHKALIAPFNRLYFMNSAKGSQKTMPKINQECVTNTLIPLPPLAEQKEIVRITENQLAKVSALEAQIATRETYAKCLMQSILKDAFEEEE